MGWGGGLKVIDTPLIYVLEFVGTSEEMLVIAVYGKEAADFFLEMVCGGGSVVSQSPSLVPSSV